MKFYYLTKSRNLVNTGMTFESQSIRRELWLSITIFNHHQQASRPLVQSYTVLVCAKGDYNIEFA